MQYDFIDSSTAGELYVNCFTAMQRALELPIGKSYALPLESFALGCLRDVAESLNVGKMAVVVLEWPEAFEVRRLPDGMSTKLFYRYLNANAEEVEQPDDVGKGCNEILRVIEDYKNSSLLECQVYDNHLTNLIKNENAISYSYIQRRCASLATFRNAKKSATEALKESLEELCKKGKLEIMLKGSYRSSAKYYKIPFKPIAPTDD